MITAAESFRLEGIEQGKLEGKLEAKREVVTRIMTAKFGPVSEATRALLSRASEQELDRLVDRSITAKTVDEVLAG